MVIYSIGARNRLSAVITTRSLSIFTNSQSCSLKQQHNHANPSLLESSNLRSFSRCETTSTLLSALNSELSAFDTARSEQGEPPSIPDILDNSPFEQLLPNQGEIDNDSIVLKNGNVTVQFDPGEYEDSGHGDTAVPMVIVVAHEESKQQLTLACLARRNCLDDEDHGELEIEDIVVEPLHGKTDLESTGSGKVSGKPYSPKIGELDEELKTSFFEYLIDRGVDDDFAIKVAEIAEIQEEKKYEKWLRDVLAFVEKEDA